MYGKQVHAQTIKNRIHEHGYYGRVIRKKPLISELNRQCRLEFALDYLTKPPTYWNDVIFCDESKFNVFGSDGRIKVWRRQNEALNKENLSPTVKYGGGSVMVWGCISSSGVGELVFIEGIMDHKMYLALLKDNLPKSALTMNVSETYKFYQDNDPKHSALAV